MSFDVISSDQNPPRLNEPESSTPIPSRKLTVRSRGSKYTQSLCGSSAETLVHIQSHDRMRREHAPEDGSSRKCRGSPAEVPAIVHLTAEAKTQAAEAWRKRMGVDRNRQRVLNTAHMHAQWVSPHRSPAVVLFWLGLVQARSP